MLLWTYQELRQLYLVARAYMREEVGMRELKEEIRWLNKKLADRIEEVVAGLEDGSSPPTYEEIAELLEGEEPEVVKAVQDRFRGEANGNQTEEKPAEVLPL